jgi:polyhydroxyalkanoate synthase subunit PhaC
MSNRTPANDPSGFSLPDPLKLMNNMSEALQIGASLAQRMAERQQEDGTATDPDAALKPIEPAIRSFTDIAQSYAQNPERWMEASWQLWQGYGQLMQNTWARMLGEHRDPVATPERGDKRFSDPDWSNNQLFDFFKQAYLITARWAHDTIAQSQDVDEPTRQRARFYFDQIANAMSPSNFAFTNPEVMKQTMASSGKNLVDGMKNLARDIEAGHGSLKIRQTDMTAFALGENMALTPGTVVYQNDLMQLIQYAPATEKVREVPLLIVPPWINKFYILDLNPKKSFIAWCVSKGLTVFVISWVNPDAKLAQKGFADYMRDGILEALTQIGKQTGQHQVNTIGYCIGGTLLASTLGYMAAKGDDRIKSATFFTTQVDFTHAGDLKVFATEEQISAIEDKMNREGFLDGKDMANAFNLLRSNDLIWSYVVNNYLKGRDAMPFDLLYWNADPTRMPAATHSFYLRECYLNNHLSQGKMTLDQVRIDLSQVKVPVFNLGAREDHIAPLPSVFRIGEFMGGETELVVAGSGHIAGVINPPESGKYQYWTNTKAAGAKSVDDWFKGAEEHPGSWWPYWKDWVKQHSGKKVPARNPEIGPLQPIEPAPGSYVKVKG